MALPLEHEIEYPTSDGQPMAETTLHRKVMSDTIGALERRYAGVADVWAGGNLLLYYQKGNPKKNVAPDVLLARGVAKRDRDVYFLWEEKPPALIFEITSKSTRNEDTDFKPSLYERLGVAELVLFDPRGEYLKPPLQGYRLERGRYRPIPLNSDGSLDLQTVGLTARPEGEQLRLVDTATGKKLLWNEEIEAAQQAAEERAVEEASARRAAEERAADEASARRAAEERAMAEAIARQAAEERATEEAAARRTAEEHARSLAEELSRLRRESKL
jgi:Uma2 family endonuclease